MYYILGSIWLAYMNMVPDEHRNAKPRKEMQEKAKTYYERAIAICKKDPPLKGSTQKANILPPWACSPLT